MGKTQERAHAAIGEPLLEGAAAFEGRSRERAVGAGIQRNQVDAHVEAAGETRQSVRVGVGIVAPGDERPLEEDGARLAAQRSAQVVERVAPGDG